MTTPPAVTVVKLNPQGEETWRYAGQVLETGQAWVRIEAFFNRPDTPFHGLILKQGDRFEETFYSDRWYNVFEIYDRDDHRLKGWYCNVTRPAAWNADTISYVDLALDLLVFPDGRQMVLDEDEFTALDLESGEENQARQALRELQSRFERLFKG